MIVLRGGTVVSSHGLERRDVYMDGDRLAAGGQADEVVDVSGCLLFPGFIDSHTHLDMPVSGTVTADDFASGTGAAIAGGTTVILDFATQDRGHTLAEALDVWHGRADGRCACDYGFHMAVTDWNSATRRELKDMAAAGVTSFKAYMAYDNLRLDDQALGELLACTGELGAWLGVHCELGDRVTERVSALLGRGLTGPQWHPVSRPNDVEGDAVARLLALAEANGGLPWVVHLSTREGLAAIEKARGAGRRVLVETCPQYLTLTEELYSLPDFAGAGYVCSPPLRSAQDRNALWRAVSAGEIDILSTDHCSFNLHGQKELGRGDFSRIPNGLPGIEQRPALIWTCGVSAGRIGPEDMCRMLSEAPARAFGLWGRKGALEPGFDADVVVWDPAYRGAVRAGTQQMRCDYSPWEGYPLTGRARSVYLRGRKTAENGRCIRPGGGQYLRRASALTE
ncbi:MAG: dihydropyrimidinase [Oscillospiraceae bacterium]|nr:dihydropyrimidinase [Oscillospiraceae bacterium]